MDQKIIILPTLLFIFWAGVYFLLRGRKISDNREATYSGRIHASLADIFINIDEKRIVQFIVTITICGALLGFFIPGKVSQADKKNTILQAIKLNQQGEYEQAALVLEEMVSTQSPLVYNELGVAYLGLNNFERSESVLRKAAKILPHYGKAHQNLSIVYTLTEQYTKAAFEETRAREAQNFHIPEHRLYNLPDNLTDQLGSRIFLAALLAAGAFNLPRLILIFLKRRRRQKFEEQLADGLVMISNGLRAGLSLVQAFEMVVNESKAPLNQEFETVIKEHHLGSSLGVALTHMAERMPGADTKIMVNATLILLESGGNLPERFDALAQTIQERKNIQLKIKSMTAEGETQAWILAALPLVLGLILNTMNHEVFSLMYTTPLGWMIMALVFIMEAVGLFLMLKMVKVKI